MANYLKHGMGMSSSEAEGYERLRPHTPRSERSRASYGSLSMSIQTVPGLCGAPRDGKGLCWRKAGHEGDC